MFKLVSHYFRNTDPPGAFRLVVEIRERSTDESPAWWDYYAWKIDQSHMAHHTRLRRFEQLAIQARAHLLVMKTSFILYDVRHVHDTIHPHAAHNSRACPSWSFPITCGSIPRQNFRSNLMIMMVDSSDLAWDPSEIHMWDLSFRYGVVVKYSYYLSSSYWEF